MRICVSGNDRIHFYVLAYNFTYHGHFIINAYGFNILVCKLSFFVSVIILDSCKDVKFYDLFVYLNFNRVLIQIR